MYTQFAYTGQVPEKRLKGLIERIRITSASMRELGSAARSFSILFGVQFFLYCIVTINTRAIAHGSITGTVVTDLGLAALNWVTIRMIASKRESPFQFWGYLLGSIGGSTLGIPVSKLFLGF